MHALDFITKNMTKNANIIFDFIKNKAYKN